MSYLKTLSYQSFLKSPYKSIKHTTYFEVYDDLFTKFRNKKIIFVEIGVLNRVLYLCGETFLVLEQQ